MDNISMDSSIQSVDKFKIGRKWFWIGIVVATLNSFAGLIYGIALTAEKDHRKEGIIIIGWAAIVLAVFYIIIKYRLIFR